MYSVKVRDHLFIAHSLNHPSFGRAQKLHGATYVVDLIIYAENLLENNIVIDIDLATKILKECLDKLNFQNLDEQKEFEDNLTTTEFLAEFIVNSIISKLNGHSQGVANLCSVKIILNESHVASASFEKKF